MSTTAGPRHTVLDATLSECYLHAPRALSVQDIEGIIAHLPVPGLPAAAPIPPPGTPGAEAFQFAAARAHALEPVTWTVHKETAARPPETGASILVDPEGTPLASSLPVRAPAAGWTHERVAWTEAGATTEATLAYIMARLQELGTQERLRVRDPHGALTPEAAPRLLRMPRADRLTLHLEDAHGLALATAFHAARTAPKGLLVRTTILGLGPRTGVPATERLLALMGEKPEEDTLLEAAARGVLTAFHEGMPPRHPLWGERRNEAAEAERLEEGAKARANPATLPHVLDAHLAEWAIRLTTAERDRILERLVRALRPGEPIDGPLLWALVAQEADLGAKETQNRDR